MLLCFFPPSGLRVLAKPSTTLVFHRAPLQLTLRSQRASELLQKVFSTNITCWARPQQAQPRRRIPEEQYEFFFSHKWGIHESVVNIGNYHEHTSTRMRVLLDENLLLFSDQDIRDDMKDGVLRSRIFVAFLTRSYVGKFQRGDENCCREFRRAIQHKKPII